ncbi:hypothetical protein BDFG_01028 [Blastomyces dermatitidis ATCC 26199]|nr:hypothetical protein BDFG_01028 [Blastomyces dermatitidis ATCC 26199]
MSKTTKPNGIKAPPSSPLHPQTPPGSRSHANPPQPVTMEQLRELFMDVLRQAKQSSDSSKPIEDTKPEINKNKEGNKEKAQASTLEYKEIHEVYIPSFSVFIPFMLTGS